MTEMQLGIIRNEIELVCGQIDRQRRDVASLKRAQDPAGIG